MLKGRYGFITRDFPRDRNPTGIYFHGSQLRGYPFEQLSIGDRVYFVVGKNEKGCVAQQIDVVEKTPIAVTQVFVIYKLINPTVFHFILYFILYHKSQKEIQVKGT